MEQARWPSKESWSKERYKMRVKFQAGERVIANGKAPGDYEGRVGTVLAHHLVTHEYQVQFDGDARGPGWLASWQLDRAA